MNRENITQRQAVSMVALFIIGSSLVLGLSRNSKQDTWISVLVAIAAMMPILYIYARLLNRFPNRDLFDICIEVFGRVFGRVFALLFTWYAFHLGALVLRNFSEYIEVTAFNQMPQTASLLLFIVLIIWGVRRGPEVMGRWSSVALPVLLVIVGMTVLLLIKNMDFSNLLPVGENLSAVPMDAFHNFAFPLAESVLFLSVLNTLKPGARPGRALLYGVLIAAAVLLFGMYFRNALVLGFPLLGDVTFPSYTATSVIIAGGFISRIEAFVGSNLLIAGFVKIGICLMAASKGVAKVLGADDYRPFVAPLGLLMVALASIVYKNTMEMFGFVNVYAHYAFPFQVILPVVLCIVAEIRLRVKYGRGGKAEKE